MNRDARNLREIFLYAVFEGAGDVVDLGDGQAAVHGAVAGDQDFVLDLTHQEGSQPVAPQFRSARSASQITRRNGLYISMSGRVL
jgi:hypothetical protein